MMSSNYDAWETPQELFDLLNDIYHFTLDAAASWHNAKCANYYSEQSLEKPWDSLTWLNPPYGRHIGDWIVKAHTEALQRKLVVCLVPARTDTKWFKVCWDHASYIIFIYGRVKFGHMLEGEATPSPFPSAIVVFGETESRNLNSLNSIGKIIHL